MWGRVVDSNAKSSGVAAPSPRNPTDILRAHLRSRGPRNSRGPRGPRHAGRTTTELNKMPHEEIDVTAAPKDRYLSFDEGISYYVTLTEKLPDHEEFKLGKGKNAKPAPVFRGVQRDGKAFVLSVTSTQLWESLEAVEKMMGSKLNQKLKIVAEGQGKERTYRVKLLREADGTNQAALPTA